MLKTISWLKHNRRSVYKHGLLFIIIFVAITIGTAIYSNHHKREVDAQSVLDIKLANESISSSKSQALAYARKALADEPNNQNAIGLVATLTPNHTESQRLYDRLLIVYKKTYGSKDPTPITYWAEANLAQKAGDYTQAKQYYEEAISTANSSSSKQFQDYAQQSQAAIEEL